jgi:hypothetical protein
MGKKSKVLTPNRQIKFVRMWVQTHLGPDYGVTDDLCMNACLL